MTKCVGCGALLQNEFKDKIGYTKDLNNRFCERCFNITHYNKYVKNENDYSDIINKIDKKNELIVYVTDFLNMDIVDLKSKAILVITKGDIIPKSINKEKLLNNIKGNFVDKIIVSSKNNYNLDELYQMILKYKKNDVVYVLGYTNAGKSTLINKMSKNYGDGSEITVSNLPSTTLDLIETKIKGFTLIDTPGLVDFYIDEKIYKKIIPKKEIRPLSYQIKNKQFILIEDFLKMEVSTTNIIIYMSNDLDIKRVYKEKECNLKKINLKINKGYDLVIKGIGFISFKKNSEITLWYDGKYLIRESI